MTYMPAALLRSMAAIIIAVRTFAALTIDGHEYLNSGWMCVIIGMAASLPFAVIADRFLYSRFDDRRHVGRNVVYFAYAAYMAYQAAAMLRLLINSFSYSNLQNTPPFLITVLLLAAGVYIVSRNGNGIGGTVKLFGIGVVIMSLIVILTSIGDMHPYWLTPVFGPGRRMIVKGALMTAGQMLAGMLLVLPGRGGRYECTKTVFVGGAAASIFCAFWAAMTPVQLNKHINRLTGIEVLLSNGRTSLAVLLPMTLIWFSVLLIAVYGSMYGASASLKTIFRNMKSLAAAVTAALAVCVFVISGLAESDTLGIVTVYGWIFFAASLLALFIDMKRRRLGET